MAGFETKRCVAHPHPFADSDASMHSPLRSKYIGTPTSIRELFRAAKSAPAPSAALPNLLLLSECYYRHTTLILRGNHTFLI